MASPYKTGTKKEVILNYVEDSPRPYKTENKSLYTSKDNTVLYSYNTPIAYKVGNGKKHLYVNTQKYSQTTSTQQNELMSEARRQNVDYYKVNERTLRHEIKE